MSTFKYAAVARIGGVLMSLLFRTLRFRVDGANHPQTATRDGKPVIFALWHGRLLPLAFQHRGQGIVTLISRSNDGEYLARLLDYWGFRNVRGSSNRGGAVALRDLVRSVRQGRSLAITPDGPRGPMQTVKPGILVAAQMTGAPIIPTTSSASRGWWPGRWDRFLIPKPFATVCVRYGEPFEVPRSATEQEINQRARELESVLNRLTEEADQAVRSAR